MKVLFINTVFGKGSTGRIIKELGDAIEASGGEYMVAFGRGDVTDPQHSYFIGSKTDRYIHAGLSRLTDRAGFYSRRSTLQLVDFIKEYCPDIIHLHNLHGYYINLPILFGFLSSEYKGKLVWTLHDCWAYTGHCTYYSYVSCSAWKSECKHCPQRKEYPSSFFVDSSNRNYIEKIDLIEVISERLTVVTVSEWLKREVEESHLPYSHLMCIHNGIDINRFKPVRTQIRKKYGIGKKYCFLCVSDGWDSRKGYESVIELSRLIDDNSCIVMVGLEKHQIKNLPSNIIGMERTWNQEELIALYSAADVLFNPSREETFGLVTAEALACGTPAIVFNVTACPEIVGDDRCGYIIQASTQSADAIKDNIQHFYITKSDKTDNCRKRVMEQFSEEEMKKRYMALYEKLLRE